MANGATTTATAAPTPIGFYDIADPSAFVHATINRFSRANTNRGQIILTGDEREELHAEGMAILCRLAVDYEPQRDGYEQEGRFSGYAAMFLPRKLGDAWHRLNENHHLVTRPDGTRKWSYGERAVSLEAVVADDPDRSELLADRRQQYDLKKRLHEALYARWCREVEIIVRVGELLSEGATPADVAEMLGVTAATVKDAMSEIERVLSQLQSEDG